MVNNVIMPALPQMVEHVKDPARTGLLLLGETDERQPECAHMCPPRLVFGCKAFRTVCKTNFNRSQHRQFSRLAVSSVRKLHLPP